jgi:hypothetical protein
MCRFESDRRYKMKNEKCVTCSRELTNIVRSVVVVSGQRCQPCDIDVKREGFDEYFKELTRRTYAAVSQLAEDLGRELK